MAISELKETEAEDESIVPCDSRLGLDVALYVKKYFPESTVTNIQSTYYRGVFIGDFSIHLDVTIEHPCIERVTLMFLSEDVPGRPETWSGLLSLPDIRLFMASLTIRVQAYGEVTQQRTVTYSLPGMFHEEFKKWCDALDDGALCTQVSTPDVFIFATEGVDLDAMEEKILGLPSKAELYRIEQEQAAARELAIDNAPPRMMEVSEREYLEILNIRDRARFCIVDEGLDDHKF